MLVPALCIASTKITTGALIIAKNKKAYEFLKEEEFQNRKVH